MIVVRFLAMAILAVNIGCLRPACAQNAVADFYHGKTFTMVIGTTPGGGYDTYGRLVARYLGRHIAGNPNVVVQNMPGAGSSVAAAYMYNLAPKDGLAVASVTPSTIMEPLIGDKRKVNFDPSKFNFVGSATKEVYVCVARDDAPVQRFGDIFSKQLIVGGVAQGGSTGDFPNLFRNLLGAKFKIINGYPGNIDILVAIERNEVQGVCGNSYAGLVQLRPAWFRPDGLVRVIVQDDLEGYPELDGMGVPLAIDFAKTDEQRQIISLLEQEPLFARPYIMAPGVPEARVEAIRAAFLATMRDPELLAEARRRKVDVIDPLGGEELQKVIARMYATPPGIVDKARRALND